MVTGGGQQQPVSMLDRRNSVTRSICDSLARWFELHPSSLAPLDAATVIHMASRLEARRLADRRVGTPGGFRVDRRSRTVRLDGHEVPLTAREADLLGLLIAGAGRVQHRRRLLERTWGRGRGTDDLLNIYIRRLRAKLAGHPSLPFRITTVHGVGYRLDPVLDAPALQERATGRSGRRASDRGDELHGDRRPRHRGEP
jgi:DNA-binding response OmpR family regulator